MIDTSWWISGRRSGPREPSRPWRGWRAREDQQGGAPRNPLQLALVLRELREEVISP